jgi:hypothetical protein
VFGLKFSRILCENRKLGTTVKFSRILCENGHLATLKKQIVIDTRGLDSAKLTCGG